MKKSGLMVLLLITGMGAAFLTGFFIGRNLNQEQLIFSEVCPDQVTPVSKTAGNLIQPPDIPTDAKGNTELYTGKIDINLAGLDQFMTLPGIGEVLGRRIIDYRSKNGPFSDLAELANINGISEKRLSAILEYLTIGGSHENISGR